MRVLFFLYILLFSINSYSLDIIGFNLPYRLTEAKDSPYQILINNFAKEYGHKTLLTSEPIKRGTLSFFTKKKLCITPASKKAFHFFHKEKMHQFDVIESDPIEDVIATIFSKAGAFPINDLSEIKGKTVATWRGIYAKTLIPDIKFNVMHVGKDLQSLSLLNLNRVDYVIGFLPDTPLVAIKNNLKPPVYNKNIILLNTPVHIVCHKTNETVALITDFNKYLRRIKNNGKLQTILGKFSVISK